jgi:hypothetical protein
VDAVAQQSAGVVKVVVCKVRSMCLKIARCVCVCVCVWMAREAYEGKGAALMYTARQQGNEVKQSHKYHVNVPSVVV